MIQWHYALPVCLTLVVVRVPEVLNNWQNFQSQRVALTVKASFALGGRLVLL